MTKETTVNYTMKEILYEIKNDINEVKNALDLHIHDETNDIKELTKHVMETNGKVKNIKWIATTALTMTMAFAGYLITHLLRQN